MAVENLLERELSIKDVNIDGAERHTLPESRELYDSLKKSPLFDAEKKLWNHHMYYYNENGQEKTNILDYHESANELLGILVDGVFNNDKIQQPYKELKKTPLYDKENRLWSSGMFHSDHVGKSNGVQEQLIDVWLQSKIDKKEARRQYERLKESKFYNEKTSQWLGSNAEIRISNQLLGIYVFGLFNTEKAQEQYEALKKSPFYDADIPFWNEAMDKNNSRVISEIFTGTSQLVGILTESLFDKESAQEQYKALKETRLYDKEKRRWNSEITKGNFLSEIHDTSAQLFGVLIENIFETEQPAYKEHNLPLPEMRRF